MDNDADDDGVCDELDNCINVFNPDQSDTDSDDTGDACECLDLVISGPVEVCLGDISLYNLIPNISNNDYDWIMPNIGSYIWQSAEDASLAIEWIDIGEDSVSIIQECLGGATQITQLNVTVLYNEACGIHLYENRNTNKKLTQVTDILGREINNFDKNSILLYMYDDGSVEKKYIISE